MLTGRAPIAQPPGSDTSADAEAREQGSQHQNRCAHGLHELVGREIFLDGRCIDLDAHFFIDGHRDAHAPEQLDHGGDVLQMRHVRDGHRPVRQAGTPPESAESHFSRRKFEFRLRARMPPWICSLSTALPRIFFRREDLQGERVDLVAHRRPQRGVDQLVPLQADVCPQKPAATTTASKCTLSCARDQRLAAIRGPGRISSAICCGFMPPPQNYSSYLYH